LLEVYMSRLAFLASSIIARRRPPVAARLARAAGAFAAVAMSLSAPPPAIAQDTDREAPAHISYVDGSAVLERDGRSETAPSSMPLLAGDRLRTQNGRVEVLFADGSTLHLDTETTVDFQSDEVIRLMVGRVRLNIGGTNRAVGYRVDAPTAWVQIARPGEYRVSILAGADVELAVLRGSAELVNEDGRTVLGAGERAFARAGAGPSESYVFNSAAWDSFDRWSEGRRDARLGVSAEYLPETVQSYAATFNTYGYWHNVPTYGYVWYPRVRPGWRPYYYGRWTTLRPWGWTWIGADPWAWPTHHYGRWGFSSGAWFWIPGRVWGPAWVSWAYAPNYVSWCPLGWNNRPAFGWAHNYRHGGRYYDHWNAWTVVPRRGFGHGYVNGNVINATHIDARTRGTFVVRDAAPDDRGYAVPRSSAPIRTAVTRNGAFGSQTAFNRNSSAASPGASGAAAAFRSRRASGAPLTGPGYPEPARPAVSAVPAREREAPSSSDPTTAFGSRSRDASAPAPSGDSSGIERRAVPRREPSAAAPAQRPASPARRVNPEYRTTPPPEYRAVPTPNPVSPSDASTGGYRAVPRGEGRDNPSYAPSPTYGVQPDRTPRMPRSEAPDNSPRAVPRSAPESSGPPPSSRSPGGGERSAPSGMDRSAPSPSGPPPQSAAPSRGSERPSDGGGTRSRSGGESSGRGVSRSRGGR
jgi:FecR protein